MNSDIVSIIIPTYNQAQSLSITLQSFLHQHPVENSEIEIIIVDDGSTDKTVEVIEHFAKSLPLKAIHQENRGRAVARNVGIKISQGNLLLFTDSDRPVSNYWIQSHLAFHRLHQHAVGIGDIREFYFSKLEKHIPVLLQAMNANFTSLQRISRSYSYWEFVKNSLDEQRRCLLAAPWIMTLIGNFSGHRSLFEQAGYFDEDFKGWGFEHFELGYRLNKLGVTFWHITNAPNYHLAHARTTNFYEQQMLSSFNQFLSKFPDPTVEALWPLLHGHLSLGEFDQIATKGGSHLPLEAYEVFFISPLS